MKKAAVFLLVMALGLSGCDAFDGEYVRVTPHTIQSTKAAEEAVAAETYTDLRDTLCQMVASGTESGVILTQNYAESALSDGMAIAKRIQAPPILAVSRRAYGVDHREAQNGAYYTRRYRELKAELLAK